MTDKESSEKNGAADVPAPYPKQPAPYPTQAATYSQYPPPGSYPQQAVYPYPPPGTYPQPDQQGQDQVVVAGTVPDQSEAATSVVAPVGNCPNCGMGTAVESYTWCGIMWAVFCFPCGLICCVKMKKISCSHCGAIF